MDSPPCLMKYFGKDPFYEDEEYLCELYNPLIMTGAPDIAA
jgi:hypothetical protein